MAPAPTALDADWLGACRRAAAGLRGVFADHPTTSDRAVEVGVGEGGDRSLVIDRDAEAIVFAELEALRAQGHRVLRRLGGARARSTSATRACA